MSLPSRICFDLAQSLKLAAVLDEAASIASPVRIATYVESIRDNGQENEMEKVKKTEKEILDTVIAYLRRVHHFIYYAGVQCLDMGDIMHAHPALFCRPPATDRDIEEDKVSSSACGCLDKGEHENEDKEDEDREKKYMTCVWVR